MLDLAEQIIGKLCDEKKLEILRCRAPPFAPAKDFLHAEEANDLLPDAEKNAVEQEATQAIPIVMCELKRGNGIQREAFLTVEPGGKVEDIGCSRICDGLHPREHSHS